MTRLDEAQEKLSRALTRLEKASRERPPARTVADPAVEAELARMRDRHAALEGEAREVSERLDAAIARVRGLIES